MDTQGGFLISQIKQVQGRIFERILKEEGIDEFNGAQGRILFILWKEDGLSITELSRRTGLAKPTLTAMLDRMEQQHTVLRVPSPSDRRQIRIYLTETSKQSKEHYAQASEKMNRIFYRGFTEAEINQLEIQLKRILNNLMESE